MKPYDPNFNNTAECNGRAWLCHCPKHLPARHAEWVSRAFRVLKVCSA